MSSSESDLTTVDTQLCLCLLDINPAESCKHDRHLRAALAQPAPALEDEAAWPPLFLARRSLGGIGLHVLQPRTWFFAKRLSRSPGQNSARGRC